MKRYLVAKAIWQAWRELNEIRARDGVPWSHTGKVPVDETYFSSVVDDCEAAYLEVWSKQIQPWPPNPIESPDG